MNLGKITKEVTITYNIDISDRDLWNIRSALTHLLKHSEEHSDYLQENTDWSKNTIDFIDYVRNKGYNT